MTSPKLPAGPEPTPNDDSADEGPPGPAKVRARGAAARQRWIVLAAGVLVFLLLMGGRLQSLAYQTIATWWLDRAADKLDSEDFDAILQDVQRAIEWAPDDPKILLFRAKLFAEHHDLPDHWQRSLEDYNKVIQLTPSSAEAYSKRGWIHRRLGRDREAIDDLNRAVELSPKDDPGLLNRRAYIRALSNQDLDLALADIQRAIELVGQPNAGLLDTRGTIYYLRGDLPLAMVDIARAIELLEARVQRTLGSREFSILSQRQRNRSQRQIDEDMAVMLYHRGEIHERQGNRELAEADKAQAERLGYNPARGVE